MPLTDYALPNSRPGEGLMLTERQLLQSTVEIARNVFDAAASSVFLIDADTGDMIFEAVAGEGAATLVGTRFPAGTGIVSFVANSGQAMLVDDLADNRQFSRDAAESTGYVPSSLMAAPLVREDDCIGVLEVLDPQGRVRGGLGDLELLSLLGMQAAISLDLLVRARSESHGDELLGRIASRLRTADSTHTALADKLLTAADELLAGA
jgi:GAF domain-containing protein